MSTIVITDTALGDIMDGKYGNDCVLISHVWRHDFIHGNECNIYIMLDAFKRKKGDNIAINASACTLYWYT